MVCLLGRVAASAFVPLHPCSVSPAALNCRDLTQTAADSSSQHSASLQQLQLRCAVRILFPVVVHVAGWSRVRRRRAPVLPLRVVFPSSSVASSPPCWRHPSELAP